MTLTRGDLLATTLAAISVGAFRPRERTDPAVQALRRRAADWIAPQTLPLGRDAAYLETADS